MILALDSATQQAGLALYDGEAALLRAEVLWQGPRHQTEWLAPAIERALERSQVDREAISALAVTIGPGSFTGLRVALSLAKGFAAARDLPLLGVPTLHVTAYPHLRAGQRLCALLQAGRGRYAFALYEGAQPGDPAPRLGRLSEVIEALGAYEGVRVVGELGGAEQAQLRTALGERVELVPPALAVRRPAVLAELAWQRLLRGEQDDRHALEPLYLSLPTQGGGDG